MTKYIIEKSPPLKGIVKIGGSKNSVLPILAATLLTEEKCVICNVPPLRDVHIMREILGDLGVTIDFNEKEGVMFTEAAHFSKLEASHELMGQIRASFLLFGPLLARMGRVKIALPGGCAIGSRPVDLHLKGLQALGAQINQEHGYVTAEAKQLTGAKIYLDFPSVGATENILMAATLANGQTTIENAAIEPEIVDLANFLNRCGAEVRGAGTDTIKINGVRNLTGTTHTIIPDRIEAGTFMAAAAITNGDIILENVLVDHLKPMIAKLIEANVNCIEEDGHLHIFTNGKQRPVDIKTLPYPGFPTDMQAAFMGFLTVVEGTSMIIETVFENRFLHVSELSRMGADIKIESRSAVIEGVPRLSGAKVKATDLRAGAALIVSALAAEGTSEIGNIFHIERGYHNIDHKLRKLGAKIITRDDA